jgi:hypothetical protein
MAMPAGAQVRIGPQYEPAAHSSLTVHIVPFVEHPQGAHAPALQVSPARQSPDDPHGLPVLPGAGPPASVASVTPPKSLVDGTAAKTSASAAAAPTTRALSIPRSYASKPLLCIHSKPSRSMASS